MNLHLQYCIRAFIKKQHFKRNTMTSVSPQTAHCHTDCNKHTVTLTHFDTLLPMIEKVTAIGLGILSAYTNIQLFVPYFIGGAAIGVFSYLQNRQAVDITHQSSSCAYGLIEQLTQVKLPPIVSLAANVAVTVCHIDHHETVFVPVIALSLGAWVGKMAAYHCPDFSNLTFKKLACHC
jgi:hypothetical protein